MDSTAGLTESENRPPKIGRMEAVKFFKDSTDRVEAVSRQALGQTRNAQIQTPYWRFPTGAGIDRCCDEVCRQMQWFPADAGIDPGGRVELGLHHGSHARAGTDHHRLPLGGSLTTPCAGSVSV